MEIHQQSTSASIVPYLSQRLLLALNRWLSLETLLIAWFCLTPIASFYFRFPTDKSLLTFDRAVFAFVALVLALKGYVASRRQQSALYATKFEIVWGLLTALAIASAVSQSNNSNFALRIAVDAFALPLVAFHAARYHIALRGRQRLLFWASVLLAIFLFATALYEYRTGINLFAYKGSELLREDELRVNGPFPSDSSFAIICLLVTLFLRLLPRWLNLKFDRSARFLYLGVLVIAAAATFLPLFRVVGFALLFCWLLIETLLLMKPDATASRRPGKITFGLLRSKRIVRYALAAGLLLAAFTAYQELSGGISIASRLTDPRNLYGRLATWQTATRIALENPVIGVGLANYSDYFAQKFADWREQRDALADTRAVNTPHSNFLWIFAELGATGLMLYLLAFGYLVRLGYRALKGATTASQLIAGGGFLVLVVAYTIPGLTLQSGAYWDLNLYFFFMLGLLSNPFLVSRS